MLEMSDTNANYNAERSHQIVTGNKIVNDAIFGFITLKPYIVSIIDTPIFQRLRCIWQLGAAPFVYPTADHSRFEHSIGTYYLASKLVRKLKKQLDNEKAENQIITDEDLITDVDVMCVEIAALCHDIAHGPFSHVWDNTVLPGILPPNKIIKHETHAKEFIERYVSKVLEECKVKDLDKCLNLIVMIIQGKVVKGKELLCYIVSNSESGMDVDKWDYLARDSAYLGHASTNYKIEIERMIHFARAIKDDDGTWKIAFRKSEGLTMIGVFQLRHRMHQTAYRHKTVVAIELMMLDGFKRYINADTSDLKEQIGTADWILKSNDFIFWQNIETVIEFKRINERDLYRPVCEIVKNKKDNNPIEDLITFLKNKGHKVTKDGATNMETLDNFRIIFSPFKLGNKDENPLLQIPFYSKNDVKQIFRYTNDNIPSNLRYNVDESRVTVFSTYDKAEKTKPETKGECEKLKENIKSYCDDDQGTDKWIYETINKM